MSLSFWLAGSDLAVVGYPPPVDRPDQRKIRCCGIEITSLRLEVPGEHGERSFETITLSGFEKIGGRIIRLDQLYFKRNKMKDNSWADVKKRLDKLP